MRPETWIFIAVGVIFVIVGILIWKKEKIDLVHSYHHNKVGEKDKKAYCALMGRGCTVIGAGLLAGGVLNEILGMKIMSASFIIGFIIGVSMFIASTAKYNR